MPQYSGVAVVPEQKEPETQRQTFEMDDKQKERATFVTKRLILMDQEKQKFMPRKRMALLLYDGIIDEGFSNRKKAEVVSPLARTFVEAKTAEELKAYSEFQLFPVDDEQDAWRAELLMQAIEHTRRITKSRAKRHELIRMKDIIGQSVKWKGFRSTKVKMNVTKTIDDSGAPIEWSEMEVPGESDIFEEIIDPINDFWIDPNASGIHDALDCAMRFRMNHEEAEEIFGGEIYDFEGVGAGSDGMVEGIMYFKKPSGKPDMLCIYCWPSVGMGVRGMAVGHVKEVYYGGLPDEHKMLPFVTYVNVPTFTHGFFSEIGRSSSGEAATAIGSVTGKQKFWAYAGDPEIMMDLIDLRTGFGRSLYKACDLAGRSIVATKGNFRIDNSVDWEHGDQIVGGMGMIETQTFGVANINAFTVTLEDIYNQMIQVSGTDPRNLTDTKQKTLGETIAQRESQFTRLEAIIDYNQEMAEVIDGTITHKLIQQYYTEPKLVRLTGLETEAELKRFDETEGEHPRTGKPLIGKQYRRIRTNKPMKETRAGKERRLTSRDAETYSFIARPEYIRSSDMDIAVLTKKRAGELQSLKAGQIAEAIEKISTLLPFAQAIPGQKPLIDPSSFPPIGDLLKEYWKLLGVSGKDKVKGSSEESIEKLQQERRNIVAQRRPISELPTPISE
jgi:hypothetical protein